jgi:hypothetical protein
LENRVCPSAAGDLLAQLPLSFEPNRGQADGQVQYVSRGTGYTLSLAPDAAQLALQQGSQSAVLQMQLVGGNNQAAGTGLDVLPGRTNYLVGSDPTQWHTDILRYGRVAYHDVYPGIDVVYHGTTQRQLEYDFNVAPGSDPSAINLRFEGTDQLQLDGQGNLILHTAGGDVVEHAPHLYQDIGGQQQDVSGRYVLRGVNQVGFQVAAYDSAVPLVIDPTVDTVYSTYLGGSGADQARAIAVDANHNMYVTGSTDSIFRAGNPLGNGSPGVFVAKFNSTGTLAYFTYLGGQGSQGNAIAVDANGQAYVAGFTPNGSQFPPMNGPPSDNSPDGDAFVSVLTPGGNQLVYQTFLGCFKGKSEALGIALQPGNASSLVYVTGDTASGTFPHVGPPNMINLEVGFVTALDIKPQPGQSSLKYTTFIGVYAASTDGRAIAVDSNANVYITGRVYSDTPGLVPKNDFINPLMPNGNTLFGNKLSGNSDALVAMLDKTGNVLFKSLLGGSGDEDLNPGDGGIAVNGAQQVYVTGSTTSTDFPNTGGHTGGQDVFVTQIDLSTPTNPSIVQSRYLTSSSNNGGTGIALDSYGFVYVTGYTGGLTGVSGSTQALDAFVAQLNSNLDLIFGQYIGGGATEKAYGIATDSASGGVYIAGMTNSAAGFHIIGNAVQQTYGGGASDAFVSKLQWDLPPTAVDHTYNMDMASELDIAAPGVLAGASDPDGDKLTAQLVQPPSSYSQFQLNADGSFQYIPATPNTSMDTFTYAVSDGHSSVQAKVTIVLFPPPVANDDVVNMEWNDVLDLPAPGVLGNDTSPIGYKLYVAETDITGLVLPSPPSIKPHSDFYLADDGELTYRPPNNFIGTTSFKYFCTDGVEDSNWATVTINVRADLPPIVLNPSFYFDLNTGDPLRGFSVLAPGVLDGASDPRGLALRAILVDQAGHGMVTLAPDGSFSYLPERGYHGRDSFTFKAYDGFVMSAVTPVSLVIDHPPTAGVALSNHSPMTNDTLVARATAADADGDPVTLTYVWKVNGVVQKTDQTMALTDSFDLSKPGNGDRGDVVSVEVTPNDGFVDGMMVADRAVVINSPPVAKNVYVTLNPGPSMLVPVLANDTDPDGDRLTVVGVTQPADGRGMAMLTRDGLVVYTQNIYAMGTEMFSYTITDGHGGFATATVFVTLRMPPSVGMDMLRAQVKGLTDLNPGEKNSLTVKLASAESSLAMGDTRTAVNKLDAFMNAVRAFKKSGRLKGAIADLFVVQAQTIEDAILKPPT